MTSARGQLHQSIVRKRAQIPIQSGFKLVHVHVPAAVDGEISTNDFVNFHFMKCISSCHKKRNLYVLKQVKRVKQYKNIHIYVSIVTVPIFIQFSSQHPADRGERAGASAEVGGGQVLPPWRKRKMHLLQKRPHLSVGQLLYLCCTEVGTF